MSEKQLRCFTVATRKAICVLLASLPVGIAYASDWQYAGGVKAGKVELHRFFDAMSVSYLNKDVIRVWVKLIRVTDFDRYYKAQKNRWLMRPLARWWPVTHHSFWNCPS